MSTANASCCPSYHTQEMGEEDGQSHSWIGRAFNVWTMIYGYKPERYGEKVCPWKKQVDDKVNQQNARATPTQRRR